MSTILANMTILDGFNKSGDVELNFYKDESTNKMTSIELISRRQGQSVLVEFSEIDNMIAMLQAVKKQNI